MKRKLRSAFTLVASLSLLAAACGDDDAEEGAPEDTADTAPGDETTPPAATSGGEDVTLSLLIDNTEVTLPRPTR